MIEEQSHRKRRIVAVVASTFISLACGTNVGERGSRAMYTANRD